MIGKLIKYEIKSGIRLMAVLWVALLVAALLAGIGLTFVDSFMGGSDSLSLLWNLLEVVFPMIYGAVFLAMIAVTMLIIVMRFYKGLLSDEGYLMHTLPVKPWQLITAKGIVASGIFIISGVVAILSIVFLVGATDISGLFRVLGEVMDALAKDPEYILVAIEVIVVMVMSVMKSVYQIYSAMAIGQLAGKYRALTSLGAYIGISIALVIIMVVIITVGDAVGLDYALSNWLDNMNLFKHQFSIIQAVVGVGFMVTAVQLVAFHIITERIMTKKLNLL